MQTNLRKTALAGKIGGTEGTLITTNCHESAGLAEISENQCSSFVLLLVAVVLKLVPMGCEDHATSSCRAGKMW